jgi:DNA (cytosine-5)-methyltransferase 1
LFAGIGGFDRAFEFAGAKIVAHCEIDPFCRAVLRRHWPKVALFEDIKKIVPDEFPTADIWTAGFPCQDVSLARGNHGRNGLNGNHTSLFFELIDLIEAKRPRVILLENVVGLLNSHKGCDFAIILRELTKHGYAVSWRVLNARYFGIPQSRSRVFMVAWRGDYRRALASLFERATGAKIGSERAGFITPYTHEKTGAIVPEIAYCLAATSGRHTGNDWARSYVSYKDRVRRPTPSESERLQGFPPGWTIPGNDYRVPARGLDSERYRAIGNAVAVPVVRWIAERIAKAAVQANGKARGRTDFAVECVQLAPDLRKHTETLRFDDIMEDVESGKFAYRWKGCGIAWGNDIVEGATAPAPSKTLPSRFVDLLDPEVPESRYFLTPNAAAGMLRRAEAVGRTFFPPMRTALENMVDRAESVVKGAVSAATGPRKAAGEKVAQVSVRSPSPNQRRHIEPASAGAGRALRVAH